MMDKEKKIKLEILGLSSGKSDSGSFALVLGEIKGKRRLIAKQFGEFLSFNII